MLSFAHPAFLLLLLAVPPLMVWWWRRRRPALRFPATTLFTGPASPRSRLAEWGGLALRTTALLLLVVAVAGPRWPDYRTRIDTEGIAIVMLLDVSSSMAEPDFEWQGEPISRLEAVKKVFHLFVEGGEGPGGEQLDGRPSDLIGLVTFASRPESSCPLTLSHSVLLRMLDGEKPLSIPGESETNISDAITVGLHRLQSAGPKRKVLVLLSDGEHNVPNTQSQWTPRQAAQIAANLRIPIYAIDAGSETAEAIAQREAGKKTLQSVAEITRSAGGEYFEAHNTDSLLKVCRRIDALERVKIQSFQYRRYYDGFKWFGLTAFVLMMAVNVLELTWWRRLP